MKALPFILQAAARGYLAPRLAMDARVDLSGAFATVSAKTWKTDKPVLAESLGKLVAGKMAKDADISDVITMLDNLDDLVEEAGEQDMNPVEDAEETEEEKKKRLEKEAEESKVTTDADPEDMKNTVSKGAMDEAIKKASVESAKIAEDRVISRINGVREAERFVRPWTGDIAVAMDTAHDVYKMALDGLKIDTRGVTDLKALQLVLSVQPKPGEVSANTNSRSYMAQDSSAHAALIARFPGVAKLKK